MAEFNASKFELSKVRGRVVVIVVAMLAFTAILMVACRDAETHFNGIRAEDDDTLTKAITNRVYYCGTVFSTVGFGDHSPKSIRNKVITLVMFGFVMFEFMSILAPFSS